jgi:hypothetical protein
VWLVTGRGDRHRRLWAAAAGLLLAPYFAFLTTLAPEHVHEENDHEHTVVHRHAELHGFQNHTHDHDETEFDHDDSRVVWLDSTNAYHPVYRLPLPEAVPTDRFELAPNSVPWTAIASEEGQPDHGPPRLSQSLRGPPPPAV